MDSTSMLRRRTLVAVAAVTGALAGAESACAHANLSPPVIEAKKAQQFTLSVPTEEEGAKTVAVELTAPSGFSIFSIEAAPGWKREIQTSGSGEERTIEKVTWSGGSVATDELAVFRFIASPESAKNFAVKVRQTYSDGKVVDWSGPESSETPAPVVNAKSSLGGGSGSTLAIIALVVAGVGVLLGLVGLAAGRRTLA